MSPVDLVLTIVMVVTLWLIPVAICTTLFRQAGYAGRLGLIALIPGAFLILPFVIGLLTWPIRRELNKLQAEVGENAKVDLARLPQGV